MVRRFAYILASAVLIILPLAGCETVEYSREEDFKGSAALLGVAPVLRFDDIPVPSGFSLIQEQSFTYQDDMMRVGLLRYAGKASAAQIISFYKAEMGSYNWRLVNIVEFGRTTLNFERSNEICSIALEPYRGDTVLSISISPKRNGSLKEKM